MASFQIEYKWYIFKIPKCFIDHLESIYIDITQRTLDFDRYKCQRATAHAQWPAYFRPSHFLTLWQ